MGRAGRRLNLQDLPDDVIDIIIGCLPKLAIRTLRLVSRFFLAAANRSFSGLQCDVANVCVCDVAFSRQVLSQLLTLQAPDAPNGKIAFPVEC